jgi:hypothetical protein
MKAKSSTQSLRRKIVGTLIITIGIGSIALLKPEISEGKTVVLAINPVTATLVTDTGHKAAVKNIGQSQAVKKVYRKPVKKYAGTGDEDKKLQELSDEVQRSSEVVDKYFNSDAFKATQHALEAKGKEMQEFYDRPELKKMQEELNKASEDFSKSYGKDEKIEATSKQMEIIGKKIGVYFNSPEFKKMNEALEDKYGITHHREYYNGREDTDKNYKKYQAELDSKLPPEIKKQTGQLKTLGDEISAHYSSPDYKEKSERLRILGDSLNKAYANPQKKEQQEEMNKLAKRMNANQDNPELKRAQEQLERSIKRLNDYINSAEYKNYLKQKMNFSFNFNDSDDGKN